MTSRKLLTTLALCMMVSLAGSDTGEAAASLPTLPIFWTAPAPREARLQQAQRFLSDFTRLSAAIPTLSPREEQWEATEYIAAYVAASDPDPKKRNYIRLSQVEASREHNIKHGRIWADNVVTALQSILEFDDDRELIAWTSLAVQLTDLNGPQAIWHLQRLGVIATKDMPTDTSDRTSFVETMARWGNIVLRNVVLPIEDGRLPRGAR